jgi:hypothetical protein
MARMTTEILGGLPTPKLALMTAAAAKADPAWRASLQFGGVYSRRAAERADSNHRPTANVSQRTGRPSGSGGSDLRAVTLIIGSDDWRHVRDAKFFFSRAMARVIAAPYPERK